MSLQYYYCATRLNAIMHHKLSVVKASTVLFYRCIFFIKIVCSYQKAGSMENKVSLIDCSYRVRLGVRNLTQTHLLKSSELTHKLPRDVVEASIPVLSCGIL